MKKTISAAALLLTLIPASASADVLYEQYSLYSTEANADNIRHTYSAYFSPELPIAAQLESAGILEQLLFKDAMVLTSSHHERQSAGRGCLTVNGRDREGAPLSFNMAYRLIGKQWLIAAVNIAYLKSSAGFAQSAICPPGWAVPALD